MALRPRSALRLLLASESAGGLILIGVALTAVLVANSAAGDAYRAFRDAYVGPLSVLHWVNDGLMALFFLLVGLEIKRELLDGQLQTWSGRALPGVAALAGMAVPAAIYVAVNGGDPGALKGWAIPAATDIAFALGVLALVGRGVPASLKVFLTAVAILDDLGAVIIIALFYTADLDLTALGLALGGVGALVLMNRLGVRALAAYLLPAPLIWWAMHESGVHATVAGVLVALTVPVRPTPGAPEARDSPLHRLEHALVPVSAYLIVPVFGFLNAGVDLGGMTVATLAAGAPLGIAAGLFLGKQAGVFLGVWGAVRTGLADLPADATWRQTYGVAVLCGIGFTMSLFIGELAFPGVNALDDQVKLGVLAGSLASAFLGAAVLAGASAEARDRASAPHRPAAAAAPPTPRRSG